MKPSFPSLVLLALLPVHVLLSGCQQEKPSSTQVAARVNDQEISVHQVQALLQKQPRLVASQAAAAPQRALNNLIEQELAAQAARDAGLHTDPQVLQMLELARREVLARAYQDKLAEQAIAPSSDEIDRYYDSQPALFSDRRRYLLQEFRVRQASAQIAPLAEQLEAAGSAAEVETLLRSSDVEFDTRQYLALAEELPLQLLPRIAALPVGRSTYIERGDEALVLTVLQSESVPVLRSAAHEAIRGFLLNEKRRQRVADGMKELRERATIERVGKFAEAEPGTTESPAPTTAVDPPPPPTPTDTSRPSAPASALPEPPPGGSTN